MRRIAAVAVTTGALVAGLGAFASPAQAAVKEWKAPDAYSNISAWGTYSRGSTKVTFKGTLRDGKKNGWTACVRFKATEAGKKTQYLRYVIIVRQGESQWYFDGKGQVGFSGSSANTGHLYVQECGRSKKTGKYAYPKTWRKLY